MSDRPESCSFRDGAGWMSLAAPWGAFFLASPPASWQQQSEPFSPNTFPRMEGQWMKGKGLFWSWLLWNREVQPHSALCPSRALLQPKQGRSSNLLWVGSSNRSRVSLIRLPSLIIPRELVGAVSLAPALRASLPTPLCASVHSTACPVPGSLSQSPSRCHSRLLHPAAA